MAAGQLLVAGFAQGIRLGARARGCVGGGGARERGRTAVRLRRQQVGGKLAVLADPGAKGGERAGENEMGRWELWGGARNERRGTGGAPGARAGGDERAPHADAAEHAPREGLRRAQVLHHVHGRVARGARRLVRQPRVEAGRAEGWGREAGTNVRRRPPERHTREVFLAHRACRRARSSTRRSPAGRGIPEGERQKTQREGASVEQARTLHTRSSGQLPSLAIRSVENPIGNERMWKTKPPRCSVQRSTFQGVHSLGSVLV